MNDQNKRNPLTSENIDFAHDKNAEEIVLGGILSIDGAINDVIAILSVDMFYLKRHQIIYTAILALESNNDPVDLVTVSDKLRSMGKLEEIGNYHFLVSLTNRVAEAIRLPFHARIIKQKYVQRELTSFGMQISRMAMDNTVDVDNTIAFASNGIDKINENLASHGRMSHIQKAVEGAMIETVSREQQAKKGIVSGVPSGLKGLDDVLHGFKPADLVVLAGRPGSGKTSVMMCIAKAAALSNNPACLFSLEMSSISLADRLLLSETDVNPDRYLSGYLRREDWQEIMKAKEEITKLPIYVDDNPTASMAYIKAICRKMKRKGQCSIILIDYLQLADLSTGERGRNREYEVSQASRQAKIIAKELNVPVILLSQLNRACEERSDKKPQMSDLRESGAIEQDADKIILVYRPEYYGLTSEGAPIKGKGSLIVAKNRNGKVAEVKFGYNESLTKLFDVV
ncbi:replicative DNA helicase [Butyricimonas synergistica]|uniref:replicative DNA helicase n=1 Tax=Butyricimonas synergistica TaxID=544644 RepID=UPI0022E8D3C4|nr:replicative DNA helicase [Butyricimonas synergistica]